MARVISLHYTLTDSQGVTIDSSRGKQPFSFMEGAGQIIPGLEKKLAGAAKGDKKKISVPAAEAYGGREESKVIKVPRAQLPDDVKPGDRLSGGQEHGAPVFVVTAVTDAEATLDGNHFLAGKDLTFDVEILAVREATEEEISHGHAHGEHGHSH